MDLGALGANKLRFTVDPWEQTNTFKSFLIPSLLFLPASPLSICLTLSLALCQNPYLNPASTKIFIFILSSFPSAILQISPHSHHKTLQLKCLGTFRMPWKDCCHSNTKDCILSDWHKAPPENLAEVCRFQNSLWFPPSLPSWCLATSLLIHRVSFKFWHLFLKNLLY